jgi:hypothetical protein
MGEERKEERKEDFLSPLRHMSETYTSDRLASKFLKSLSFSHESLPFLVINLQQI